LPVRFVIRIEYQEASAAGGGFMKNTQEAGSIFSAEVQTSAPLDEAGLAGVAGGYVAPLHAAEAGSATAVDAIEANAIKQMDAHNREIYLSPYTTGI
jgi:hypothetical protein